MEELLNWKQVSLKLAKNDNSIRKNRVPEKYKIKVNNLIEKLNEWDEGLNEKS